MSFGARHRAATKPIPLTSRNSRVKTMISVMWSLIAHAITSASVIW